MFGTGDGRVIDVTQFAVDDVLPLPNFGDPARCYFLRWSGEHDCGCGDGYAGQGRMEGLQPIRDHHRLFATRDDGDTPDGLDVHPCQDTRKDEQSKEADVEAHDAVACGSEDAR